MAMYFAKQTKAGNSATGEDGQGPKHVTTYGRAWKANDQASNEISVRAHEVWNAQTISSVSRVPASARVLLSSGMVDLKAVDGSDVSDKVFTIQP